jgi:hypothetical protein
MLLYARKKFLAASRCMIGIVYSALAESAYRWKRSAIVSSRVVCAELVSSLPAGLSKKSAQFFAQARLTPIKWSFK